MSCSPFYARSIQVSRMLTGGNKWGIMGHTTLNSLTLLICIIHLAHSLFLSIGFDFYLIDRLLLLTMWLKSSPIHSINPSMHSPCSIHQQPTWTFTPSTLLASSHVISELLRVAWIFWCGWFVVVCKSRCSAICLLGWLFCDLWWSLDVDVDFGNCFGDRTDATRYN